VAVDFYGHLYTDEMERCSDRFDETAKQMCPQPRPMAS
jgi:hypothetical protein